MTPAPAFLLGFAAGIAITAALATWAFIGYEIEGHP